MIVKVIQSGHIIEIYEYEKMEKMERLEPEIKTYEKRERKNEYKEQAIIRARNNLKRLILSNFNNENLFITLTFKENLQNREIANREFKKFIQRVNRYNQKHEIEFKYVAVIEYQKRGAIHYHMICNMPIGIIEGDDIKEKERNFAKRLWKNGFIDIKNINKVDNVGAYLLKYLSKDFKENHEENKRAYLYSRNLEKPKILQGDIVQDVLEGMKNFFPVFASNYETDWQGKINYREYNLLRGCKEDCI